MERISDTHCYEFLITFTTKSEPRVCWREMRNGSEN